MYLIINLALAEHIWRLSSDLFSLDGTAAGKPLEAALHEHSSTLTG